MKRIVVGYDGSAPAHRALEVAAALASDGASIEVVSSIALPPVVGHGSAAADPAERAERSRVLAEAKAFFAAKGIEVEVVEGYGEAADVLIDRATDAQADLIVVGTRGLNAAKQLLLGSVSTKVVHHAPCSVLVAR